MARLTCKAVILDYLAEYLDNSLGPEALADLGRHLANRKACVAYLNTYQRTRELAGRTAPRAMPGEMKAHLRQPLGHSSDDAEEGAPCTTSR